MTGFTIAAAQLSALFMQSISFGIHIVTFGTCVYAWFCRSGRNVGASSRWMPIAIAFFVVGACDVSFNFYHNLVAFTHHKDPGGADAEFKHASSWVNVMRLVWLYIGATLSDIVMIYRCWIVYAQNRHRLTITIPSLLLWLASIAYSIAIVYDLATSHAATTIADIPRMQPFIYAFYTTSLVLNLYTTGCIIVRLWGIHRSTASAFTSSSRVRSARLSLADLSLIIVESALLYTATVSVVLEKTNADYGVTDVSLEVAGISFDLIIIRIWRGTSVEHTQVIDTGLTAPHLSLSKLEIATRTTSVASFHTAPDTVGQGVRDLQATESRMGGQENGP